MTITIAGGTGTVGAEVTRDLLERSEQVRVLTRDAASAAGKLGEHPGLEIVQIDFADPKQLVESFKGAESAYIGLATTPSQVQDEISLIDAAEAAGVSHLVKLSCEGVDTELPNVVLRFHREIETHLRASGLDWTMVRPATFVDAVVRLSSVFIPKGVWGGHTLDGAAAFVDTRDVAEVAAQILIDGTATHRNRAYRLTGSEALTMQQVAELLTSAIGTEVRFHQRTDDETVTLLEGLGMPRFRIDVLLGLDELTRAGIYTPTPDDTEAIIGRAPRSPVDYIKEFAPRVFG